MVGGPKAEFKVTGTNEVYALSADPNRPKALDEVRRKAAETVTIEGRFQPPKDSKTAVPLMVSGVKQ